MIQTQIQPHHAAGVCGYCPGTCKSLMLTSVLCLMTEGKISSVSCKAGPPVLDATAEAAAGTASASPKKGSMWAGSLETDVGIVETVFVRLTGSLIDVWLRGAGSVTCECETGAVVSSIGYRDWGSCCCW